MIQPYATTLVDRLESHTRSLAKLVDVALRKEYHQIQGPDEDESTNIPATPYTAAMDALRVYHDG